MNGPVVNGPVVHGPVVDGPIVHGPNVSGQNYIVNSNSFPVPNANHPVFVEPQQAVPQSVFQPASAPVEQYTEPYQPSQNQYKSPEPTTIQLPNTESIQPTSIQPPAVESIPDSVPFPTLGKAPAIPTGTATNRSKVRQATHVDSKGESDRLFSKLYR